jgi:minor histocompatibility antigen H13
MTARDALTFPLIAGAVLTALWAAFRYFDKDSVNAVLAVYFVAAATAAVGSTVSWGLTALLGQTGKPQRVLFTVHVPYLVDASLTALDVVGLLAGLGVGVGEAVTHDWRLNNLVASCLAVQGVARLSVGRFSTAAILLAGLFVYDIFMVFGTGMMQNVALQVRGPILLKFPRPIVDPLSTDKPFGILGLGDIVLPGAFLALVLRFDATLASVWKAAVEGERPAGAVVAADDAAAPPPPPPPASSREDLHVIFLEPGAPGGPAETLGFEKPVYGTTLLAYAAGLVATIVSMHVMDHAQPALLFLVPAVLLGSIIAGWRFQVLSQLLQYSEESEVAKSVESSVISATVGDDQPTPHPQGTTTKKHQ